MKEGRTFFQDLNKEINAAIRSLDQYNPSDPDASFKKTLLRDTLETFDSAAKEIEPRVQFNIDIIGQQFRGALINLSSKSNDGNSLISHIDDMISSMYRFIIELQFNIGKNQSIGTNLKYIKGQIEKNIDKFNEQSKEQINYASYFMVHDMIKNMLWSEEIISFRDFKNKAAECASLKDNIEKTIEEHSEKIKAAENLVRQIETSANFVGLSEGFKIIKGDKSKELENATNNVKTFGWLLIIPIVIDLAAILYLILSGTAFNITHLAITIPLFALEIFLLYFFRIALTERNELKAQILQIDLRLTLCQFIQSYAEYSAKIKKDNGASLDKFENLIFSSIIMDGGKIPATFDGLDQISKLASSFKK